MKILVVDDHAYNRDLLLFILQDEGHECVEAENGKVAVETYQQDQDIDLVLMDVNMPEMDGITATKEIKASDDERFVPVIFITALDDNDMIARCLEAGGDDFVPKPVIENILIAKINAHSRSQALYNRLKNVNSELKYHKQLMDREHAIVEHVFANGAKRQTFDCENITKYTSPVSMFDGDLVMVGPSPSGGAYILVGDFTGHGLAAAIGSLPVMEIFFNIIARQGSVSQLATDINKRLNELLPSNMFFCAAIVYVNSAGDNLTAWSGGMNEILIKKADDPQIGKLCASHMPLGILDSDEFDDSPTLLEMEKDSKIYIYTDGIVETNNAQDEEFGVERLEEIVVAGGESVVDNVVSAVREFHEGVDQLDDLSIVELTSGAVVFRSKETNEIIDVAADYHNAESFPWTFSMRLENEDLRNTNIVNQTLGFISSIQGIELHQDKIFTIVSELFSNALEHGVLRLESSIKSSADGFEKYYRLREERLQNIDNQYIDVQFSYIRGVPNQVKLVITDSGDGFDYVALKEEVETNDDSHGRGVHLLESLCSSLDYSNDGKTVTAIYDLCQQN